MFSLVSVEKAKFQNLTLPLKNGHGQPRVTGETVAGGRPAGGLVYPNITVIPKRFYSLMFLSRSGVVVICIKHTL